MRTKDFSYWLLSLASAVVSLRPSSAWIVENRPVLTPFGTKSEPLELVLDPASKRRQRRPSSRKSTILHATTQSRSGNLHGQGSCFLPLKQLNSDYYAPRIVQIAGAYPGLSRADYDSVQSEPPAEQGQWSYDFSDPDGPQLGTMALDGSNLVASCQDPVIVIAAHRSLGVELPKEVVDDVDLVVLVDRSKKSFGERKFLVVDAPSTGLILAAFANKAELPEGAEILGQVELVQIPWLPCMQPTKTGFMEEDEYF